MEKKIQEVKEIIENYFDEIKDDFFQEIRVDFTFGKMLRSKLLLSIAPSAKYNTHLCAIIELIHFASLLHDDVIDNSLIRRGKTSINAKYGNKNAIMLGDILYSKAFYEVVCIKQEFAKIISNAVYKLSLGELQDVHLSKTFNTNSQKYITMIGNKTAALIEASAIIGGMLINQNINKYQIYGNALGIAFQIIDDLLDITKEDSVLGKQSFSDFKEGKSTLPYIYLYQNMTNDEKNQLLSYFKKDLTSSNKRWIKEKFAKYDIVNKTKNIAIDYGKIALDVLEKDDDKLKEIIKAMIEREF